MKSLFKTLLLTVFMFHLASSARGQDYLVSPVENFFAEFRDKRQIIKEDVMSRDLTLEQRLALYDNEMNKLRDSFRLRRKQEYESKYINLSVSHSCTSKSSGGKKDCGWKSVSAPIADLYTTQAWLQVKGDSKGIKAGNGGSTASIKMTVAGKGRNAGTLTATYRYRPKSVARLIEQELVAIFGEEKLLPN